MREDMAQVVIERPRWGSSRSYHQVRPRDIARRDLERLADLPRNEGMRRPHVNSKSLSDLLGPLRKFLVRQVGRPWNKVHSEICERISPNSTIQLHILGHLDDLIETRVRVDAEGRLQRSSQRWRRGSVDNWPGLLYVHPRTGIIRRVPEAVAPWKRRRQTPEPEAKTIGTERELWCCNGIWYWAVFATAQIAAPDAAAPIDCLTGLRVPAGARYRAGKRQASTRDLRRHGLSNEAPVE
ncbi:MAG TPA: hypothetical protein VNV38_00245 [Stellaceae bacterium]|jgi:hypothetical protein|nr:hypothetical protein [Stellaceae bacterium]